MSRERAPFTEKLYPDERMRHHAGFDPVLYAACAFASISVQYNVSSNRLRVGRKAIQVAAYARPGKGKWKDSVWDVRDGIIRSSLMRGRIDKWYFFIRHIHRVVASISATTVVRGDRVLVCNCWNVSSDDFNRVRADMLMVDVGMRNAVRSVLDILDPEYMRILNGIIT